MKDCGLRQKWRGEDGVAGSPVSLLLGSRDVTSSGAKKDLRDRETDLFAVCGESYIDVEQNHKR